MKTKFHLIAGVAMVAALASCSSDDLVDNHGVKLPTDPTTAYAKVNIAMKGSDTRATTDGGFDFGSANEAKVNSITLVLYGEAGDVVAYGSLGAQTIEGGHTGNGSVSDTYPAEDADEDFKTVELTVTGSDITAAKKVVAYVNMNADVTSALDLTKTVDNFGTDGNFAMTNAGYMDGSNNWTVATDITDGSIYSSKDAAQAGAASTTIYVERLAAKVSTAMAANAVTTADINIVDVKNKPVQLVFQADDAVWAPTGTAKSMYALKNQWTETTLNWTANAADNFRSYWAAGVNYNTEYGKMMDNLTYLSSNALRGNVKQGYVMKENKSLYTFEHTYGETAVKDPKYNALGAATSVILLGQYKVTGENAADFGNDEEGYDFYLLLNSVGEKDNYTIYNEDQLKDYLLKNTKGGKVYTTFEDQSEANLATTDDVELQWDSDAKKYTLTAGEGKTLYAAGAETAEDVLTTFAASNARHYNLGYAYFYAPIEHNNPTATTPAAGPFVGQYGVVRNHSYNMTINSIKSLGAPLDDDHFGKDPDPENPDPDDPGEQPIEPDPTTAAYLDAVIKVLSWHVINQVVDL